MSSFGNVIALVVFNFESHVISNIRLIQKLYGREFKDIIYYSDTTFDEEYSVIIQYDNYHYNHHHQKEQKQSIQVNYLNTQKGYLTHKVFPHFYHKYKHEIDKSDGVFYFMDDCIINTKLLNKFSVSKPIIMKPNLITGIVSDWQWIHIYKERMEILTRSGKHHMLYYGMFSDYFYLPQGMWTDKLISKFELFAEYDIFIEIAIPTVLREFNIEYNGEYVQHSTQILWNDDRLKITQPGWVENQFTNEGTFVIHPIKLSEPDQRHLLDFMMSHH
jgi:hypothetical protein